MRLLAALSALGLVAALGACSGEAEDTATVETKIPDELATFNQPDQVVDPGLGTPLEERVATLGVLNKRNNLSQDIEIKPGESRRWGDVIVRLASCERTAPWERPAMTGAFVQVLVARRDDPADENPDWIRVFSGWLFKESPSLNVVEHPIYDVWVKDCAMSFPGEEPAPAPANSEENPDGTA
ncbi:MAG TPA: DUF2155 domain-containing protein [Sphingomonadaceae bacterium]|nr:DUF2155 domain-containing protein [Sphingomonadaceae bacterium]